MTLGRPLELHDHFTVVATCNVHPGDVCCLHQSNLRLLPEEIAQARDELVRQRANSDQPLLTDSAGKLVPLYRLARCRSTRTGQLVLETEVTDYAEFIVTNLQRPRLRAQQGDAAMSDPLGVCAALVTCDDQLFLARRNLALDDQPSKLHVIPSGHAHPPQSLWHGLLEEMWEETGLSATALAAARCLGVIRAQPSGKPELVCHLRVSTSASEVSRLMPTISEHSGVRRVPWHPDNIRKLLLRERFQLTSPAFAAIVLAGGNDFGKPWTEDVVAAIRSQTPHG